MKDVIKAWFFKIKKKCLCWDFLYGKKNKQIKTADLRYPLQITEPALRSII